MDPTLYLKDLPAPHDNGMWISEKVSRIVELIREYDPKLDVKIIPDHLMQPGDAKFAITERLADGREVVAFYIHTEADFDERVLARIYAGDNAVNNVQQEMELNNLAVKALRDKEQWDAMQQAHDEARFILRTQKNTIKHNGKTLHL